MTRAGGLYIAVTLFLGFAAVNTGNNLIFLIVSALLGFMAVSGVVGWLNIKGLGLSIEMPEEIYEGIATIAAVRVFNRKRVVPSFLLRLGVLGEYLNFNSLGGRGKETGFLEIRFSGRGRRRISAAEICSPFPVNFFVRCMKIPQNIEFLVIPYPKTCAAREPAEGMVRERGVALASRGEEGEMALIADYSGAEPMKMIHWRLSAKHEDMKVKVMSGVSAEPVIIEMEKLPGAGTEERLSCAVYLVNRMSRAGRPVGLKLGEGFIKPALSNQHRLKLLHELAAYGQN